MSKPVAVIYKKPITGALQGDVSSVLKRLKGKFLERLRVQVQQATFSRAARAALSKAMKVEVKKSSLVLTVNHPAWRPLVEGQRMQQMVWLKKAKAPIPIVTDNGKVIFRTATAKSLRSGKWVHPGRQPSNIVEKARKDAREWAKKTLPDLLRREIARTLGGK